MPGVPDAVDVRGVSGVPDAPGVPDVGGVPDAPGVPDVGGVPDAPGVPGVPGDPGDPGDTVVPDGGADPEDGETNVDVGVDGDTVDVVVVGSDGCGGVDDEWSPEPGVVGVGLVPSVVTLQMALTTETASFKSAVESVNGK